MIYDDKREALDSINDLGCYKRQEKEKSSISHVNKFINNHFTPENSQNSISNCDEITYEFLKEEGLHFVQTLATYFATKATIKRSSALISMNSADGYFSAFKMMCFNKFTKNNQNAENLPCFATYKWKSLRHQIIKIKTDQAKRTGE